MIDHQHYNEAIAAIQHAKENGLRFLAFIDQGDDKFTTVALCSPHDLAGYIGVLLQREEFAKVILMESAQFAAEQMGKKSCQ